MNDIYNFLRQMNNHQNSGLNHNQYSNHSHIQDDVATLSEKKKKFILSQLSSDNLDSLFEQSNITRMGNHGPMIEETRSAHIAGCGHLIGLTETNTLGALCNVCDKVLCSDPQCSLRCDKCDSIVCRTCSSEIDEKIICTNCRFSYVLIKRIKSFFLGIHHILSRSF